MAARRLVTGQNVALPYRGRESITTDSVIALPRHQYASECLIHRYSLMGACFTSFAFASKGFKLACCSSPPKADEAVHPYRPRSHPYNIHSTISCRILHLFCSFCSICVPHLHLLQSSSPARQNCSFSFYECKL